MYIEESAENGQTFGFKHLVQKAPPRPAIASDLKEVKVYGKR
jgi:hypothetical protein